jgi:hypothetical protein
MVPKNDIDGKTMNDYHQRCPYMTKHEVYLEKVFIWIIFSLLTVPFASCNVDL